LHATLEIKTFFGIAFCFQTFFLHKLRYKNSQGKIHLYTLSLKYEKTFDKNILFASKNQACKSSIFKFIPCLSFLFLLTSYFKGQVSSRRFQFVGLN